MVYVGQHVGQDMSHDVAESSVFWRWWTSQRPSTHHVHYGRSYYSPHEISEADQGHPTGGQAGSVEATGNCTFCRSVEGLVVSWMVCDQLQGALGMQTDWVGGVSMLVGGSFGGVVTTSLRVTVACLLPMEVHLVGGESVPVAVVWQNPYSLWRQGGLSHPQTAAQLVPEWGVREG